MDSGLRCLISGLLLSKKPYKLWLEDSVLPEGFYFPVFFFLLRFLGFLIWNTSLSYNDCPPRFRETAMTTYWLLKRILLPISYPEMPGNQRRRTWKLDQIWTTLLPQNYYDSLYFNSTWPKLMFVCMADH